MRAMSDAPQDALASELAFMRAHYPSRIWDVADSGRNSWTTVNLITGQNTDGLAVPVRSALETMAISVDVRPVRNWVALPSALGPPVAPYTVLCLHGDGQGNFLGAGHIGVLAAAELAANASLQGSTVISIACSSGRDAYVDAILNSGAAAYIAPEQPPLGHAGVMFLVSLFFFMTQMHDLEQALARTANLDAALSHWRLFRTDD